MLRLIGALVLAIVSVTVPYAQTDVTGAWELTINGPQGSITADASLKQTGDKLTGTFSSPQGEVEVAGTVTGNALRIQFNVATQQGPLDIIMTADIDGDSMKGVIDFSMGTADFTGKKK
jgi:hypothetical protein